MTTPTPSRPSRPPWRRRQMPTWPATSSCAARRRTSRWSQTDNILTKAGDDLDKAKDLIIEALAGDVQDRQAMPGNGG